MIIDGCNFIFNSAPNGIGGAIYAPSVNTEITITGSKAELNSALKAGFLFANPNLITITTSTFDTNTRALELQSMTLIIEKSNFINNQNNYNGGAINIKNF